MSTLPEPNDEVTKSSPPYPTTPSPEGNLDDPEKQQNAEDSSHDEAKSSAFKSMGWLDRFLALWIFLAMAVGIILGEFVPSTGPALQKDTFVGVSVPIGEFPLESGSWAQFLICVVAVGLLVMMYPIMCKVRFETLHLVFSHRQIWRQIAFSIVVNWIIAPFLMVNTSSNSRQRFWF